MKANVEGGIVCLLVGWLTPQQHARDRSAQTILRAATLR